MPSSSWRTGGQPLDWSDASLELAVRDAASRQMRLLPSLLPGLRRGFHDLILLSLSGARDLDTKLGYMRSFQRERGLLHSCLGRLVPIENLLSYSPTAVAT